jgi:hypothetical protein
LKKDNPTSGNESPDVSSASIPASPVKDISFGLGTQDTIALDSRAAVPALQSAAAEEALENPADDLNSSYFFSSLACNGVICVFSDRTPVHSHVVLRLKYYLRHKQSHYQP